MPEAKFIYVSSDLTDLFKKEYDVLDSIKAFCLDTEKGVEVNYSLCLDTDDFMLEIIVRDERKSRNN
jgi:hypothetical protein